MNKQRDVFNLQAAGPETGTDWGCNNRYPFLRGIMMPHDYGLSQPRIAVMLGVPRTVIERWVDQNTHSSIDHNNGHIKHHAITLRKQGWSERMIAAEVGVPRQTINRWFAHNGERISPSQNNNMAHINKPKETSKPYFEKFFGS